MDASVLVLGLHYRLAMTLAALERGGRGDLRLLLRAAEDLFTLMAVEEARADALHLERIERVEPVSNVAGSRVLVEAQRALLGLVRASTEDALRAGIGALRGALGRHNGSEEWPPRRPRGARARRELEHRVEELLRARAAPGFEPFGVAPEVRPEREESLTRPGDARLSRRGAPPW